MPTKKIINKDKIRDFFLRTEILDFLPQDMDIVDKNCRIVYMNKSLLAKFGKKSIGKKCYEVYKENKKQCLNCPLKKPIKVGEIKTIEVPGFFGGKIVSILHKGIKINGEKFILEIFNDITEKNATEIALRESREKYLSLFNGAVDAIFLADPATRKITECNGSAEKLTGYSREEICAMRADDLHPKDIVEKTMKEFKKQAKGEMKQNITEILTKDKKRIPVSISAAVVSIGGRDYMQGVFRNITAQKIAEEKNKRLSEIIEKIYEPVALVDLGKTDLLRYVNPAWEKTFGYSKEEVVGKRKGLIIEAAQKNPELREKFLKSVKEGKMFSAEMVWKHKKGKLINVEVFSAPVRSNKGEIMYWFNTIRDITEHKKAEEALKRSEKRYRRLFETTKDGILILNADNGKIVNANPFVKVFLGYPLKEMIGKEIWQVGSLRYIVKNKEKFFELKRKKYVRYEHLPLETKKGVVKHIEFISNVYDVNGEQVVQCNIRDITDRYMAVEALLESEEKNRLLYQTAADAIMTLEPPLWKFTSGNVAIRKMFGVKNEKEFVAYGPLDLSPKYQPDGQLSAVKAKKMIKKAMKEGSNYFEWTHKRVNGENFFATVLLNRIYFKGKFILQARVQDISARKKTEAELLDNQQRLSAAINGMGDGLFVVDKNGYIILFNNTASLISGFSVKEALKTHYSRLIKFIFEKTEEPLNGNFIIYCLQQGKSVGFLRNIFLIKKNLKRLPVTTNASPLKDKDGNVVGAVVLFRDASKEREIDKMKTEFVSLASHQLKTPLTGIKWFTELLLGGQSGALNKEQKEYLERVYRSNERLIALVNDLLDVSHIDAGVKFDIVKKPTDIVKIVNEVLQDKINLINEKKINIIKCAGAPDMLELPIDKDKIRQVFDNLTNNAIKYSKIGGTVEMGCAEQLNDKVIIYIKDNGVGIPKKQQKKVFEKFFRADNAVKMQTDGTGLGLYIAKAIVKAHGGDMWFESKQGKGSTFYFSLPIND